MRVLIYTRQSIESEGGQHSLSIDSQVTALTDHCQREGWTVIGVVRESGLRGWMDADERPGLAQAITQAESGQYTVLLVWDLSRLARSVRLQEQWVWQFTRYGVEVVSHTEPHAGDALIRQVLGAIAEQRSREISAHVRRALRENALRGIHHGPPPFGYHLTDERRLAPSEDARIVQEIFRLRASGLSWAQMAEALEQRGIRSPKGLDHWAEVSVRQIVINPAYRGALARNGTVIERTHEPIIDEDLWSEAHARRFPRARAPRRKDDGSWLEGLITHGCGYPMYAWRGAGRTHRLRCSSVTHRRHVCAVTPNSAMVPLLERLTWEAITEDLGRLRGLTLARVVKAARRHYHEQAPAADAVYRDALGRRERALARRARAEDLYLSGQRDRAWFDVEEARCAAEITQADSVLAHIPAPPDDETLRRQIDTLRGLARDSGLISTPGARATLLRALGVAVFDGTGVRIDYRPEWAVLFASVVVRH